MTQSQPHITRTTHTLPFDKLSPRDFERLCLWLVEREGYERAEHLGAAGSEQGRDIVAWREGALWAFQCKRMQSFGPKNATEEVKKVLALPKDQRPTGLVFLVTCDVSANTRQQARERCKQTGMECHFWVGTELDEKVKHYPDIVDEFFSAQAIMTGAVSTRPIPWHEVKLTCQEKSSYHLSLLRHKYRPELYVERGALRQHIDRFLSSRDTYYLVLNGRSGMGKTAFLCRLEEDFRKDPAVACLVYDCGALRVSGEIRHVSLLDSLAEGILPKRDDSLGVLLDRIEKAEGFSHQKLVIIVDAINENKNMDGIIQMLADLQRDQVRPWIKVIISCRPHVWPQVSGKMMLPLSEGGYRIPLGYFYKPPNVDDRFVEVTGFSEKEAEEAYKGYQKHYEFKPEEFRDLAPVLQARLKEPLLLWLVSAICAQDRISIEVAGSDISVIPAYIEQILKQLVDGKERERAVRFLEETLPKLMVVDRNCYNTASLDDITDMPHQVETRLKLFVEAGILELEETEETADRQIRFRYERFYDYYFGHHLRKLANRGEKLDCRPTTN